MILTNSYFAFYSYSFYALLYYYYYFTLKFVSKMNLESTFGHYSERNHV